MMFAVPKPFPVLATLLALAGIVVLVWLGHWQQERLVWKNNLQTAFDQEFAKDAQTTVLNADELGQVTLQSVKRGTLNGQFDFSRQVILQGQIAEGKAVNYVLIPFLIAEQTPVFVVAGYQTDTAPIPAPRTRAKIDHVTGVARIPQWSSFASDNDPAQAKWYRADIPAISKAQNLEGVLPVLFYLESSNYKMDALPRVEISHQLRNDHRQYMFFWYTMAAILSVMYFLRFWRKSAP